MGSYYLRQWHRRWFEAQMPASGVVLEDISDITPGVSISGPRSRELLQRLTDHDVSGAALPFMSCATLDIGLSRARVGRLSLSGELGFEINVPAAEHRALYRSIVEAGRDLKLAQIGFHALNSLRVEKSYGIWSREFSQAFTPRMSGLDRFVAYDKSGFIGRDAALKERDGKAPAQRLVTLEVEAVDADASGNEPVWAGDRLVGRTTSGAFGHSCGRSLALAYLDTEVAEGTPLALDIVGQRREGRAIPASPVDPAGGRPRS